MSNLNGKPVFSNPILNKAISEMDSTFSNYKASVDKLCSDIVALERLLQEKLVLIPVRYELKSMSILTLREHSPRSTYHLVWEEDEKSKKFRLFYERVAELVEMNEFESYYETEEKRPLAEAPLSLRVSLFAEIPMFLKKVKESMESWSEDSQHVFTSIPPRPLTRRQESNGASLKQATVSSDSK
jgi:hypothetical protein